MKRRWLYHQSINISTLSLAVSQLSVMLICRVFTSPLAPCCQQSVPPMFLSVLRFSLRSQQTHTPTLLAAVARAYAVAVCSRSNGSSRAVGVQRERCARNASAENMQRSYRRCPKAPSTSPAHDTSPGLLASSVPFRRPPTHPPMSLRHGCHPQAAARPTATQERCLGRRRHAAVAAPTPALP